ncbi:MAG: PRC-barrel domain-containing protein [Bryobacteraceae bacterium]
MRFVPVSRQEGYNFPPNTFDVRGWQVMTALDREKVGKVDDILVDETGRPRFLDVDVGIFKKHVLVPLGQARLDSRDDVVWIEGVGRGGLENIPEYTHDPRVVSPDYELRLNDMYRKSDAVGATAKGATAAGRLSDRGDHREEEYGGFRRLSRLTDLNDYRVAEGDTDPRGWDVITGDGHRIGNCTELIVDTQMLEATYLDTDIDEKKLNLEAVDRHILVPIEAARLDRARRNIVVDGLFLKDVGTVPLYSGLPLTSDSEDQIHAAYQPGRRVMDRAPEVRTEGSGRRSDDDARYLDRFYGARRGSGMDEGDTTMLSSVDREVRIRLSGEDIIIERRPRI